MKVRLLTSVLSALVAIAGCTPAEMDLEDEAQQTHHVEAIRGMWALHTFTENGQEITVESGENTAVVPMLVFDDFISGVTGCNKIEEGFESRYTVENRTLTFGDIVIEAGECASGLMRAESALVEHALWAGTEIRLTIAADMMTWQVGEETLMFRRSP